MHNAAVLVVCALQQAESRTATAIAGIAQNISQNRLKFDHVVCFPLRVLNDKYRYKMPNDETNYLHSLEPILCAQICGGTHKFIHQ